MGQSVGIGIVGVGVISEQYFSSIKRLPNLRLIAVADIDMERAHIVAAEQHCQALSVNQLMNDSRITYVLNLTTPQSHKEIIDLAVKAGKNVFTEKPLALTTTEILPAMKLASEKGVHIGCAPDTVLGTGIQTSKKVLDSGKIGEIVGASAFWSAPGHELWHPSPSFYYQPGAGPLYDMGPYYLSTLITLLGPIKEVIGSSTRSHRVRTISTGPKKDQEIPVNVDTHINAILYHENGLASTITLSFEIWGTTSPLIEIFGTQGTLSIPDPNQFSEIPKIRTAGSSDWQEVQVSAGYTNAGRGYGLSEMVAAISQDRKPRLAADLGYHVLEVFESILLSAKLKQVQKLKSTVSRMDLVPLSDHVN